MSTADIEHSPEPNVRWFPWPAAAAQPGEPAWFKIASTNRPEYQEALARAYRKHGVRVSKPDRRPLNLLRATIDAMSEAVLLDGLATFCSINGKPFAGQCKACSANCPVQELGRIDRRKFRKFHQPKIRIL